MADAAPIRHTAPARLDALHRSTARKADAAAADARWCEICPAYVEALETPLAADVLRVECDGLRLAIPSSEKHSNLGDRLFEGRLPWQHLLGQRTVGVGRVVIDIGANVGSTSITCIVGGDAQRVYALEPEPRNYHCLVQNIVANGLRGFVLPEQAAISDMTGTGHLNIAARMGSHALTAAAGKRSISIQTWRLDDWVGTRQIDIADIALVEIDTQGWEGHALRGAPALVAQQHIAWVVEVSPGHLADAGTTMADFLALLGHCFTHAVDLTHGDDRAFKVKGLSERLAYLGTDERFTDLLLYSSS